MSHAIWSSTGFCRRTNFVYQQYSFARLSLLTVWTASRTQMTLSCTKPSIHLKKSAFSKLQLRVSDIKSWLTSNKLKSNDIARPRSTVPSPGARNLGVGFDNELCFTQLLCQQHICRHAALVIYKIGQIRKYLHLKTTEHKFVTSRLDYCNSLVYGLRHNVCGKTDYNETRQCVFNTQWTTCIGYRLLKILLIAFKINVWMALRRCIF